MAASGSPAYPPTGRQTASVNEARLPADDTPTAASPNSHTRLRVFRTCSVSRLLRVTSTGTRSGITIFGIGSDGSRPR